MAANPIDISWLVSFDFPSNEQKGVQNQRDVLLEGAIEASMQLVR